MGNFNFLHSNAMIALIIHHGRTTMNRPTGVTIIAVLALISGTFSLCGGCFLLGFGAIAGPLGALFGGGQLGSSAFLSGISWSIGAAISLAAGFGMLSLKQWAWWLGLIGATWSLASSIWGATQGASWCFALIGMLLPAIVVIYLLQPRIRQAFGRP
jgi:hypothetical protein